MNWKRFFLAFLATFVFLFVFGFVWYAKLMDIANREAPALWRPEAEFGHYFGWLLLGHVVMSFFFAIFCARFVPAGGAGRAAALGLFVGLVYAGVHLIISQSKQLPRRFSAVGLWAL